ncbi:MAG: type VI secretion system contractile sheath large subunit, partial [Candidatus Eisenbacteria bacterium]|nr:type VI secretion system contractile sheath large subunit [Candidatus Eisenbacteria bacterium]
MKCQAWRILIVADLGVASSKPIVCDTAYDWMKALRPEIEIKPPKGNPRTEPVRLNPTDLEMLKPDNFIKNLEPAGPVDAALLDAILHDPAFQRLESAVCGISTLKTYCEASCSVEIVSTPRKDLAENFRSAVFDYMMQDASAGDPYSLILLDFDFTHQAASLAALRDIARMAKVMQAPIVASASPGFFDFRYMAHVSKLGDLTSRLVDSSHLGWIQFQATDEARWTALTINRYLQRAPYQTENYTETVKEAEPESFLWGRGIYLVGSAVARSVKEYGHALAISGGQGGMFAGLPVRPYPVAANESVPLAAETALEEMKVLELYRAGFIPVWGKLRSDTVALPMMVTTFRMRPGTLTLEGTLPYQLTAARLAQCCILLLDHLPAGGPEETAEFIRLELTTLLGELAGEQPDKAVQIE